MKSLYLLVDFFTIIIPLIFSFHPKIKFYRAWTAFFPAALVVGFMFLVWDELFTSWGVWGFNPKYIIGIYLYNLPLEEILFFICIPFSCVFTYYCLNKFFDFSWNPRNEAVVCLILSVSLIILGLIHWDRLYTSVTFISTGLVCLLLKFWVRINWFGNVLGVYGILLIPFFMVNGVLTGTGLEEPVVWYNHGENLNLRLLTIPLEDAVYGFELILLNIYFFKWFESKFTTTISIKS